MSAYSITTRGLPQGTLTPMGALLFAASEPGAWYDPSDMSTLFQDSAGTVPVTAVEQPVGRVLDKSGRGNHATQSTTTKRPAYSRRVNLLGNSRASGFTNYDVNVTLGAAQGPDGSMSAALVSPIASSLAQFSTLNTGGTADYTCFVIVKKRDYRYVKFLMQSLVAVFDLDTGAFVTNPVNYFSQALGDGWYLVGATKTVAGGWTVGYQFSSTTETGSYFDYPDRNRQVVPDADGIKGNYFAGASLTLATDAHLPYQWVNTATDYDADPAKFPAYLRFDGVDDALQTGNIDFTGTDKMTVWAGISVSSSSDQSGLFELGVNSTTSNGLSMQCMASPFTTLRGQAFGTSRGVVDASGFALNTPYQVCAQYDLSAALVKDEIRLRKNGAYVSSPTLESSGTGNFSSYPLTIMARGYMNTYTGGRLYPLIVRGAQSNLSQIEAAELYMRQKMRLP